MKWNFMPNYYVIELLPFRKSQKLFLIQHTFLGNSWDNKTQKALKYKTKEEAEVIMKELYPGDGDRLKITKL